MTDGTAPGATAGRAGTVVGLVRRRAQRVDRLRALVGDSLALSRAEGTSTSLEQVALREVVHDRVTDLRMTAGRRGVEITLDGDRDDPLLVLADRGQASRAVLDVVGNALKQR